MPSKRPRVQVPRSDKNLRTPVQSKAYYQQKCLDGSSAPLFFDRAEYIRLMPDDLIEYQTVSDIKLIRSHLGMKPSIASSEEHLPLAPLITFSVLYRYTGMMADDYALLETVFFETVVDNGIDLRFLALKCTTKMLEGTIISVHSIERMGQELVIEDQFSAKWRVTSSVIVKKPEVVQKSSLLYVFKRVMSGLLALSTYSCDPILIRLHSTGSITVGGLFLADLVRSDSGWICSLRSFKEKDSATKYSRQTSHISTSHPFSSYSAVALRRLPDHIQEALKGSRLREIFPFTMGKWGHLLVTMLLGSRERDYHNNTLSVRLVSLIPPVLFFPPITEHIYHFVLYLHNIDGEVPLRVKRAAADGKWLKIICHPSDHLSHLLATSSSPFRSLAGQAKLHDVKSDVTVESLDEAINTSLTPREFKKIPATPRIIEEIPLISAIYGDPNSLQYAPSEETELVSVKRSDGATMVLNTGQSEAVRLYSSSDCPAFIVISPPGSGKTTAAAAMAVSYRSYGVQLLLSTANVPVYNMVKALTALDYSSHHFPVHLVARDRSNDQETFERSPFDIVNVIRDYGKWAIDFEDIQSAKVYIRLAAAFEEAKLEKDKRLKLSKNEMDELEEELNDALALAFSRMVARRPPNIIFATVDMILLKDLSARSYVPDPVGTRRRRLRLRVTLHALIKHISRIIIDEASQLTESTLNCLALAFPHAQMVLIGDTKQMPPFRYEKGVLIQEWSAKSALDVALACKNFPIVHLHSVYRAPQSLIQHYSDCFYDGKLRSEKDEEVVKPLLMAGYGLKQCVFLKVNGKTDQIGTSKINEREIVILKNTITKLKSGGFGPNDVMIISYYEAQRKAAKKAIPKRYEVLTVDASQGREKPIVVVLTTVSSMSSKAAFIRCPLRCNVAVSRHKRGLIVIGSGALLEDDTWSSVLSEKYFSHYSC